MADEFSPDWPHGHTTRDGLKARIICTDAKREYPIVALVEDNVGVERPVTYTMTGKEFADHATTHLDLINRPGLMLKVGQVVEGEDGRIGLVVKEIASQECVVVRWPDEDKGESGGICNFRPHWDYEDAANSTRYERYGVPSSADFGPRITRIVAEPGTKKP